MGFLNKSVLQKKATAATTEKHPLLKDHDVPLNVKRAYLQGCVLAVLERDDGKVNDAARQEISRLGQSLELTEEDIAEIISVVSGISSPDAQDEFLGELFPTLAGDVYPRYFMPDFESLLTRGEECLEDLQQTLDFFGSSLTGKTDWRDAVAVISDEHLESNSKDKVGDCRKSVSVVKGMPMESASSRAGSIHSSRKGVGSYLVNGGLCVGCCSCISRCPAEAIVVPPDRTALINSQKCINCGVCDAGCPAEAILPAGPHVVPDRVANVIIEILGVNPAQVVWDAKILDDLGADELDTCELVMAFEEEFGMAVPEEDADQISTVGDFVRYLWAEGFLTRDDFEDL